MLVCIAGLPQEAVEEIHQRSAAVFTEEKANTPIIRPVRQPYSYRDGMADAYLEELKRRFETLPVRQDATVLLAYVAYDGDLTKRFVDAFFPFALAAPLQPFYPDAAAKHERRLKIRLCVNLVEKVVAGLRERARVVRDLLSGQNFSPLLLPLRNFRSNILAPLILDLFQRLGTSPDPRAILQDARSTLLASYPLHRLKDRGQHMPYFQDDRSLRFKSPGRNRHGMARIVAEGHRPSCLIASRVRLGGPFDPLFHYDCEHEGGSIDRHYPNCHDRCVEPSASTHVNIAPNDAIR